MSLDNEIRNLGYIAWKNDLSWMESQKGEKWATLIKEENKYFKNCLKPLMPLIKKMESELDNKSKDIPYILDGWKIKDALFGPQKIWTHVKSGFSCKCWDADFSEDMFVAAVQVPGGFERFTIEIYAIEKNKNKLKHLKTIKDSGPEVAIVNGVVYFLHSEKDLRYSSLCKWTEGSEEIIFNLKNLEENLELKRGEDRSVYLIRSNFTKKYYCLLNKNIKQEIKWLNRPDLEACIVSDNLTLSHINTKETIESFSIKAGWTVSISKGIRTLWKGKKPLVWIWGDISYDSRNPFRLDISDIRYEPYTIMLPDWKLSNPKPVQFPCSYYNNPLPTFVIHPNKEIRGLLVTAYGAYGTPTYVGSLINKWKPLLLRGWIIASVMVPGSGDDNKKWIEEGQRLNRLNAIEQLSESIKSLQYEHNISPLNTALYGRSAGGLLAASVAIRSPGLVGSLYLESSYLDILRTMTNPDLPLTTLETSEYGISPTDFIATAAWSPMEHIPKKGIPELFVIARTDIADLQVLPYESLKFIQRVRGSSVEMNDAKKLVYVHTGLGHFTTTHKSRAEDLALLESSGARIKNLGYKYKMPPMRKNRNMTRKNRNRKNRNRKNRNSTMGGRRRH